MMKIIRDSAKEQITAKMKELAKIQPMDGDVLKPFIKDRNK